MSGRTVEGGKETPSVQPPPGDLFEVGRTVTPPRRSSAWQTSPLLEPGRRRTPWTLSFPPGLHEIGPLRPEYLLGTKEEKKKIWEKWIILGRKEWEI